MLVTIPYGGEGAHSPSTILGLMVILALSMGFIALTALPFGGRWRVPVVFPLLCFIALFSTLGVIAVARGNLFEMDESPLVWTFPIVLTVGMSIPLWSLARLRDLALIVAGLVGLSMAAKLVEGLVSILVS